MRETLLILGASARAAAQSARRAGFAPVCGDLFADVDLRDGALVTAVADFPSGLEDVARRAPPGVWMYTGGLENHPVLVERIAATRPLLGNPASVLRRIRDPIQTSDTLRRAGLDVPECRVTAPELFPDGLGRPSHGWLHKGRRSSGGNQVHVWRATDPRATDPQAPGDRGYYFQQWIEGPSCGAVYVAARGEARLLGVTEQLLAGGDAGENRFRYAGSVGPLRLSPPVRATFEQIGQALAGAFGLIGLFGVDAIVAGERVWPVEVNPRYPASAEILDWASESSAVGRHMVACLEGELPAPAEPADDRWYGKRIHFARRDSVASPEFCEKLRLLNVGRSWPAVADIPAPATQFRTGQPVATVLAEGASREIVLQRLAAAQDELAELARVPPEDVRHEPAAQARRVPYRTQCDGSN